jgi:hypothetical protein
LYQLSFLHQQSRRQRKIQLQALHLPHTPGIL